jgi:hypothetical protein
MSKIILSANLKGYFFEGLSELNRKSQLPVPESTIFYSSDVLDKFALSEAFFECSEGKVREKILGVKLLEAAHLNKDEQRRLYKEVADMSLLICGYFSASVNRKLVDLQYYSQIGRSAYSKLYSTQPDSFFGAMVESFGPLTTLMTVMAKQDRTKDESLFILPAATKKVS